VTNDEPHVTRLSGHIGAELTRLDLAGGDPRAVRSLHDALLAHQVVFVPAQHLGPGDLLALAGSFGEIMRDAMYATRVVGLQRVESDALLGFLRTHVADPTHACRYHWSEGTFAMWDNRCTMHRVASDYEGERIMHRVTVADRHHARLAPAELSHLPRRRTGPVGQCADVAAWCFASASVIDNVASGNSSGTTGVATSSTVGPISSARRWSWARSKP
jgi:hypothetical protein